MIYALISHLIILRGDNKLNFTAINKLKIQKCMLRESRLDKDLCVSYQDFSFSSCFYVSFVFNFAGFRKLQLIACFLCFVFGERDTIYVDKSF